MARGKKKSAARAKRVAPKKVGPPTVDIREVVPAKKRFQLDIKARKADRVQGKSRLSGRNPVPGAPTLFVRSLRVLADHWKLFGTMLVIYAVLHLLLVGGVTGGSSALSAAKSTFGRSGTHTTIASQGVTLISTLVGSSNGSDSAGVYQTFLLLIMSVVIIWALRQVYASNQIRARDAFYQGTYPLVQFILVLLLVGVELLPLGLGVGLYSYTVGGGVAVGLLEDAVVFCAFILLAAVSAYLICSSLVALYIVTLPDMTPLQALRNARDLVRYRRWIVLRKLLFLPVVVLVIGAIILLPVAIYLAPLALTILLMLSVICVAVVHSYMYALYRELL